MWYDVPRGPFPSWPAGDASAPCRPPCCGWGRQGDVRAPSGDIVPLEMSGCARNSNPVGPKGRKRPPHIGGRTRPSGLWLQIGAFCWSGPLGVHEESESFRGVQFRMFQGVLPLTLFSHTHSVCLSLELSFCLFLFLILFLFLYFLSLSLSLARFLLQYGQGPGRALARALKTMTGPVGPDPSPASSLPAWAPPLHAVFRGMGGGWGGGPNGCHQSFRFGRVPNPKAISAACITPTSHYEHVFVYIFVTILYVSLI